jgi:hypothetical protein
MKKDWKWVVGILAGAAAGVIASGQVDGIFLQILGVIAGLGALTGTVVARPPAEGVKTFPPEG